MREVLQHVDYRKAIWVEHERILNAVLSRNAADAAALARAHLQHAAASVQIDLPSEE
jgi:DNA-binding GntR family transcriptional regulator